MAEQKPQKRGAHPYALLVKGAKVSDFQVQMSEGKQNAKSRKYFFIGPAGSGKTTLAGYFPDPFFVDIEEGVNSIPFPVKNYQIEDWNGMFDVFSRIEDIECQTIVINDLTTMSTILVREVAKAAGKFAPDLEDRGVASEHLRSIIYNLFTDAFRDKYIVLVAQVELHKDERIGSLIWQSALPGKMPNEIPPFCDEVWRFKSETPVGPTGLGKTKYTIQTVSEAMWPGFKSRKGIDPVEDVTGEENIKKLLRKVGVLE